jgi:hypothetical protein
VKYLVMELLQGIELGASLAQPWTPARAVDTITQILEALTEVLSCSNAGLHQRADDGRDLETGSLADLGGVTWLRDRRSG